MDLLFRDLILAAKPSKAKNIGTFPRGLIAPRIGVQRLDLICIEIDLERHRNTRKLRRNRLHDERMTDQLVFKSRECKITDMNVFDLSQTTG